MQRTEYPMFIFDDGSCSSSDEVDGPLVNAPMRNQTVEISYNRTKKKKTKSSEVVEEYVLVE